MVKWKSLKVNAFCEIALFTPRYEALKYLSCYKIKSSMDDQVWYNLRKKFSIKRLARLWKICIWIFTFM